MNYDEFIMGKTVLQASHGFEPMLFTAPLFEWQKLPVAWAVRRGRSAMFEECGLGKGIQLLEWAYQIVQKTSGNVLIVAPLAVGAQLNREAVRFGIPVTLCREMADVKPGINITNYERIEKFDPSQFVGVGLDESSRIKAFTGKLRGQMTDMFKETPYKLCCTATPAPNDFTELGQHADFLGICSPAQMLATYFINDTFDTGTWRLKGHATEAFWEWVSSWACCISKPSDLGFPDEGFNLPPVKIHKVTIKTDITTGAKTGELFRDTTASATTLHAENRITLSERCSAAAQIANDSKDPVIVWCASNDESELLTSLIPDAVEVTGSMDIDEKESGLLDFVEGRKRVLISKGKIAGFGLNLQHCWTDIYVGLNHSFETYYQCGKRIHRFGQTHEIQRYIIQTDGESGAMKSIIRKEGQHQQMRELIKFTKDQLAGQYTKTIMNTEITMNRGKDWTFYNGDCVRVYREKIKDESIGFTIFSPPFADLFTYSSDIQDMGNCKSLDAFMEQFGYLIDELTRVTMPGRECAVHCCDLLATKWKDGDIEFKDFSGEISRAFRGRGWLFHSRVTIWKSPVTEMQRTKAHGLLYKTLQSDSSRSRVGAADYLLVFRKRGENPEPITHTPETLPLSLWQEIASPVWMTVDQGNVLNGEIARDDKDERHICPLQLDVIKRALILWTNEGDLVSSPFGGIASEGVQSLRMKRKFVGSELKESYFQTGCKFMTQEETERRFI